MDGGNSAGQIAVIDARKSGVADHCGKALLWGEFANALNQIPVGLRIAGRELAQTRDHLKRMEIVKPVQDWHLHLGEFEAEEAAASL